MLKTNNVISHIAFALTSMSGANVVGSTKQISQKAGTIADGQYQFPARSRAPTANTASSDIGIQGDASNHIPSAATIMNRSRTPEQCSREDACAASGL
jgi:hypothetical protein